MVTADGAIIQEVIVMKNTFTIGAMIAILILGTANIILAADYPTRPITLICPVPPGGSHDVLGRIFTSIAGKYLEQPVVLVNKPGATTMVGSVETANALPDGYTLLEAASTTTQVVEWEIANGRKPPFTRHDFISIGSWSKSPTVVVVPYNKPWKTVADLVKDLKAKPNQYAFCSGGLYGSSHIPVEFLLRATGTTARHVPFQGGGPCLSSLVGGHVDFGCQFPSTCIPLERGKKLRILAVQSSKRLNALPEVPTLKELGMDAEYYMWLGIAAPRKTPMPVVEKLREVFRKVVQDKSFIEKVESTSTEVEPMIGDELTKFWDRETAMYSQLFNELVKEKK